MSRASCLAVAVGLTRKAMLYAQFFKKLFHRLRAARFHILIAAPDAFHGFTIILLFPREIICQQIIESRHSVLSMPFGISIQLRLAFWFHREQFHEYASIVTLRERR